LRKIFLFFSILNKFYKQYKEYFEEFYEFCIKKHIFSEKNMPAIYDYQKDPNFNLSSYNNYVIIFASNSKLDLFKDVSKSINDAKPFQDNEIEFNLKKCFEFPLKNDSKEPIPKIDLKIFPKDNNEKVQNNVKEITNDKNQKKGDDKLFNSYREFKHLILKINEENNFKVKLIYLDLYLNVLAPKCEIIEKFDKLNKKIDEIKNEVNNLKRPKYEVEIELEITKSKLEKTESKLQKTESELEKTKKLLINYIHIKDPDFKLEDLI